jgi:hypothetical protein
MHQSKSTSILAEKFGIFQQPDSIGIKQSEE